MTVIKTERMMKVLEAIQENCNQFATSLVEENKEILPDLIKAHIINTEIIAGIFLKELNNKLKTYEDC